MYYLVLVPALLMAVTFHEYAHARTALAFGDRTAYERGRVSLNPFVHLDPIGTLMLLLVGFGWGKPVPVTRSALRYPRADLWVSAAGPLANLALAWAAGLTVRFGLLPDDGATGFAGWIRLLIPMLVYLNVSLAVFNLLPVGALDGVHVLENLLPAPAAASFHQFNRTFGLLLLIFLLLSPRLFHVNPLAVLLETPTAFLGELFLGR